MKRLSKYLIAIVSMFVSFSACASPVDEAIEEAGSTNGETVYASPKELSNRVVAHRGGSMEDGCPDNSIEALRYTIGLGCYASECDIYITKDEKVVVAHGVEDKINGLYPWKATYAELTQAGKLTNGETLPLLEDYLKVILESGTTRLWIDVKTITNGGEMSDEYSSRAIEKASEVIRTMKAKNFVEVIVGKLAVYRRALVASKGEWKCAYMNASWTPEQFANAGYTWANFEVGASFYHNGKVGGKYTIEEYIQKGARVSVYNVDTDDDRTWYAARKEQLYAICTNYPKALLRALK